MKSSGIKRGLAAFAISAVAVTGLPAFTGSAFADNINTQAETENTANPGPSAVVLYNDDAEAISTKPDGTDSTVRLEAGAGRLVETIRFEYMINGGASFITIADVTRNDDGAFSFEWASPPVGQTITIRARDITPAGAGNSDTATGVQVFGNDPNVGTINLTTDSQQGYFASCDQGTFELIVNGTSSVQGTNPADDPRLLTKDGDGNTEDGPLFVSQNPPSNAPDDRGRRDANGNFSGILQLNNYDFTNAPGTTPNQVVVEAETDAVGAGTVDTSDFEAYTLYQQTIGSVTVTDNNTGNGSLPTEVTVLVRDQNGAPIAGALVFQSDQNGNLTGNTDVTDARGEAQFDQFTNPNTYFADNDCNGTFQSSQGDRTSGPFAAGNSSTTVTIASNPEGTVPVGSNVTETVTVRNANGDPIVNRQVRIERDGPGSTNDVVFRQTDANGQASYTFTCTQAGTVTITAGINDPSGPVGNFDRETTDTVECGEEEPPPAEECADPTKPINPGLKLVNVNRKNRGMDFVKVGANCAKGAKVRLFLVTPSGNVLFRTGNISDKGQKIWILPDRARGDERSFFARVSETDQNTSGTTQTKSIR